MNMGKGYSKEYLYEKGTKTGRPISILFKSFTASYNNFGEFVVVEPIWDDEFDIKENFTKGVHTYGQVKARIIMDDHFTKDQIDKMKQYGFHTEDVSIADHV